MKEPAAPRPNRFGFAVVAACLAASTSIARADEPAPPNPVLPPLAFIPEPPRLPPSMPPLAFPVPIQFSRRSLVLPTHVLVPSLEVLLDRSGPYALQSPNVAPGLALGLGRNTEIAAAVTLPSEGVTQPRVAGTIRLMKDEGFQLGLRAELSMAHQEDDAGRDVFVFHPGLSLPVVLSAGVLRVDTGLAANLLLPTRGDKGFALSTRTNDPSLDRPGVPLEITFQPTEVFYLGADSGIGFLPVPDLLHENDFVDGFFVPLGASAGFTFATEAQPIIDVVVFGRAPYLLLLDERYASQRPLQLGVTIRGFVPL